MSRQRRRRVEIPTSYELPPNPFVTVSDVVTDEVPTVVEVPPVPRGRRRVKGTPVSFNPDDVSRLAQSEGKVHVGAGFTPGEAKREYRRQQKAAKEFAKQIDQEKGRRGRESAKQRSEELKNTNYLPKSGEKRSQALRTYRPARAPSVSVTANVAAVAYPFLAEAGLGSKGILIGSDAWSGAAFVYDPWELYAQNQLTNPNVLLAGIIGRGKSTIAKSLATRSIAVGRKIFVACDPKGEWTVVSKAVGGMAIELGVGSTNRLNPLDAPAQLPDESTEAWRMATRAKRFSLIEALSVSSLGRDLRAVERTALEVALDTCVATSTVPVLGGVVNGLLVPDKPVIGSTVEQLATDGREVGHALRRLVEGDLRGLFDGPSTVSFDASLPMVSIDMSAISGSDTLIAMVSTCAASWVENSVRDPRSGQKWIIYDEAWRLLRNPALLARMQEDWKLSRARGIANLMVIHRLSDLDAVGDESSEARNLALGLLADCSTKIIYAQERGEALATGTRLGLSDVEIEQLPQLSRGQGLWRVGERSFLVNHRVTPGELALFDTNQRMVG